MANRLDLRDEAPLALAALQRGQWDDIGALVQQVANPKTPLALAWGLAFRGAQSLVRGPGLVPSLEEAKALPISSPELRPPLRHVCDHGALAAVATLDLASLGGWAALAEGIGPSANTLGRVRTSLSKGDFEGAYAAAHDLGDTTDDPAHAIEAQCVRALVALALGEHEDGLRAARQASSQARQSGLRAYRFLAGLVLARLRRVLGRAHLAQRILAGVASLAPPTFRGWLAWETTLATGGARHLEGPGPVAAATSRLHAVLDAARAGDRPAFDQARGGLRAAAGETPLLAGEIRALEAVLDPAVPAADAPASSQPFLSGEDATVPFGLGVALGPTARGPLAYILRSGTGPPRRVVARATPLVGRVAKPLRVTRLKKGRVDLACALLALAEDGLSDQELFRACYGFKYVRELHESVLSMLVSRVRERFEGHCEVHRAGGWVHLDGRGPILVPDPRCVVDVDHQLLGIIARMGSVTTRRAARELDVGLRTLQQALARLVDEGEVLLDRHGRSIGYRMEDTSFGALTGTPRTA